MKKIIIVVVSLIMLSCQRHNASSQRQGAVPDGFVRIKGGTFMMGSPTSERERENDEVQHKVTVKAFYMGKYEVTQKEWFELMGTNPGEFKGDNLPVESVSWYDVVEYCNMRSQKEGLIPAYTIDKGQQDPNNKNEYDYVKWTVTWNRSANGYRLPTEAEWEYACRAGTTTPFSTGSNITTAQANYDGNKPYNNNDIGECREETTPVGSFAPNPWGLFDMHGNVFEWCWDWYRDYSSFRVASDSVRVIRGGAWRYDACIARSAYRGYVNPVVKGNNLGFRLVRP